MTTNFVTKRPHKKSRGGCKTCKTKKVKVLLPQSFELQSLTIPSVMKLSRNAAFVKRGISNAYTSTNQQHKFQIPHLLRRFRLKMLAALLPLPVVVMKQTSRLTLDRGP